MKQPENPVQMNPCQDERVRSILLSILVFSTLGLSLLLLAGCGNDAVVTSDEGTTGDKQILPANQVLTAFGNEYGISRRKANGDVTTKLRDTSTQVILLTLDWSISGGTYTYGIPGLGSKTGTDTSQGVVTLEGSNVIAYMIHLNVQAAIGKKDSPGCDGIPDYFEGNCVRSCCDTHDACYARNDCTAWSWLPYVGSAACDACNDTVVGCFSCCFASQGGGPYGEPCDQ